MDPFTHALSGAVIGAATAGRNRSELRRRALWGTLFALFPDIDYILLPLTDHFTYLNAHRGITHSVLMLPVWAGLLGWIGAWLSGQRWRDMALLAAAAVGAHIVGDLITSYGTKVLAPVYDAPLAFPILFIVDPVVTAILLVTLVVALWRWQSRVAVAGLLVLAAYLLLQTAMYLRALELGRNHAVSSDYADAPVVAFPQPLSPFNWQIIVVTPDAYYRSYVNLLIDEPREKPPADANMLRKIRSAYRPVDDMHWQRYSRWPQEREHYEVAYEAWSQPEFSGFRQFALLPYVTSMRGDSREVCVWFADLRFTLHAVPHPFEYAMCRGPGDQWRLEFDKPKEWKRTHER